MAHRQENAYIYTVGTTEELLRRTAQRIHELPHDAEAFKVPGSREPGRLGSFHLFLERAPGLYCTARIESSAPSERRLWLEFRQGLGFPGVEAWDAYLKGLTSSQKRERLRALTTIRKQIKIDIGYRSAPDPAMTEPEREILLESAKEKGLADAASYLWKIWRKGSKDTPLWRSLYINPDKQTPDDTFAQLAVTLLREGMVPEADTEMLQKSVVDYLRRFGPCNVGTEQWLENAPIATRVLHEVVRGFTMPRYWPEWWKYVKTTSDGLKKEAQREIFSSREFRQFIDEDGTVYSPYWVAKEFGRSKRTVDRWMTKHGFTEVNGRRGLSHAQYADFELEYKPKKERARLRKKAEACGMTQANFRQLVRRKKKKKPDGTPDWEKIEAHVDCRSQETETAVSLDEILSVENQIAMCEEFLSRAKPAEVGIEVWERCRTEVLDKLRQLRRFQQSGHH